MNWKTLLYPLILLLCSCKADLYIVEVAECDGIDRPLEFIRITLPCFPSGYKNGISLKGKGPGEPVAGQFLGESGNGTGSTYIFPISIGANQEKRYRVTSRPGDVPVRLETTGEQLDLLIENEYFIADLTGHHGIGTGHLTSLQLKYEGGPLLHRSNLDMHWAPSFQKTGMAYKTMSHVHIDSSYVVRGPYFTSVFKQGSVEDYEEIELQGEYQFFAGSPFFIFSSEILVEQAVSLVMLRNDEMTMDSLFTHVVYPVGDSFGTSALYDREEFQWLKKNPIEDDAPWLAFYHSGNKYASGCIRLQYNNLNPEGMPSPLMNPHTRITKASKGGRYWNRMLIIDRETEVPAGSRYLETNAYFAISFEGKDPSEEIEALRNRIMHPVNVRILTKR